MAIAIQSNGGLYLPALDLWLDPREGKPRAFVSHAHADHFANHDWTLCSPVTGRLIESRYGSQGTLFTPPWAEPMEMNGHLLRLLPAGHIFGSAMLHVARIADGESLLYTGDFKLRKGRSAEAVQLRHASTLVMETTFGLPKFRFPPAEATLKRVHHFVQQTLEDGGIPVLLGYSLGKAQEILAVLADTDWPVMLHSSVARVTHVYDALRGQLKAWSLFDPAKAAGHVIICPPSAGRSAALRRLKGVRSAMLSGWALEPGATFRYQVDEAFPLSDHADYEELLQCVETVRPHRIYTIHGYTSEFARDLRARGWEAWSLAGENQLELGFDDTFSREPPALAADEESPSPPQHPDETFGAWATVCEAVAGHASRLAKTESLSAYLARLSDDDLSLAVRWLSGMTGHPALPPLQVGRAIIRHALMTVCNLRERDYRAVSQSQNDAGRTAYLLLSHHLKGNPTPWTLSQIDALLNRLRDAKGPSAKARVLEEVLTTLSAMEGSYLVRLLTGELRIGSKEGLVEDAIAHAFGQPGELVREAVMLCGDVGQAAVLARHAKLNEARPAPGIPLKVMLASPEPSAAAIAARHDATTGPLWAEPKYDGIRAQAHAGKNGTALYSRDQKAITDQFPELAESTVDEAIFDGEIIAYSEEKRLTFHDLQRRLGRRNEADLFIPSDISVQYVVFDLLYLNGRSLLKEPLTTRRQLLETLPLPRHWKLIEGRHVSGEHEIEQLYHQARHHGHEGLIVKEPQSSYTPGRRGKTWLKLKKAFSTLDVVVVKAERGHGKRNHLLSDYTFAVRDADGTLRTIGKAYSGLTDEEIEELTEHFRQHTLRQRGNVHTVIPNVILEIAFDSIRPSQRHDSGLALRFPRIRAIRRDKTVDEIDTLEYAASLAVTG